MPPSTLRIVSGAPEPEVSAIRPVAVGPASNVYRMTVRGAAVALAARAGTAAGVVISRRVRSLAGTFMGLEVT
ncbi:hypothetical protein KRMM14A1004_23680 [Krasilnikovia sp. MM14-A1004]